MFLALFAPALAGVMINEVLYDAEAADDGNEWIELCNDGAPVDLAGWSVESAGTSFGTCYELGDHTLAGGEYLLIGLGSSVFPGAFDPNLQNGGSETDGVRLVDGAGNVVDTVLYDDGNSNSLPDDSGEAGTSFAPDTAAGESLARWPDCVDTDQSGDDFAVDESPTPGAANELGGGGTTTGGDADCADAHAVTINEFSPLTDVEFVEIYAAADVDLSGWVIEFGTSSYNKSVVLPEGVRLSAGERYTVGSAGAPCKDLEQDMDLGNAGTNADAVRLTCNGAAVDTVVYAGEGKPNEDGWADDSGKPATSMALVPPDGSSMGRSPDGYDTDDSGADFYVQAITACEPNPPPPECNPSPDIRLNEFLYDPDGSDTDLEWVEITNSSGDTVDIEGWTLQAATSDWSDEIVFPDGTEVPPGGYLVVGGVNAPELDVPVDGFSLGNGTEGDGIRLVDCDQAVADTVLYGETMADGLTDDAGGSDVVPEVDSNVSLGRYPNGVDTDAIGDWHAYTVPTPGEANPELGGGGDDTGKTGVTGCGGERPESSRPAGACNVAPTAGGWLGALLLVWARRRNGAVRS